MNGAIFNASANARVKQMDKKSRRIGISMGLISGLTYGMYTTLVLAAGCYEPLLSAVGLLAAPFVTAGLNDLFAGIWLTIYNAKCGRLSEIGKSLKTFPGKMVLLGALAGGPIANGAYLAGLALAGAYAIPISATCALFGAVFSWIFLGQKPTKRVFAGMMVCVAGAIVINWVKPEGSPNFTVGIICTLLAAISWGLEGTISSYGGVMLDADVAVNIRDLFAGIVDLVIIVPVIGALPLLTDTVQTGMPLVWLALSGLCAAVSFVCWYRANAIAGCAIGMSLNVTYAFWGVLFCVWFLGQELTASIAAGSVIIVFGAILVTMNPLELFQISDGTKGENY